MPERPERVVFDTNVWISGSIWHGAPYRCLLLARSGVVQAVYCPPMVAELTEKLRDKFRYSEHEIRAVVYELRRVTERVSISGQLRVVAVDPDDDKFVECAVVAGAATIVSDDRHLLDLGTYEEIRILSSSAFLDHISRRQE